MPKKVLTISSVEEESYLPHSYICDNFYLNARQVHERRVERVETEVNDIYAQKRVRILYQPTSDQCSQQWFQALSLIVRFNLYFKLYKDSIIIFPQQRSETGTCISVLGFAFDFWQTWLFANQWFLLSLRFLLQFYWLMSFSQWKEGPRCLVARFRCAPFVSEFRRSSKPYLRGVFLSSSASLPGVAGDRRCWGRQHASS